MYSTDRFFLHLCKTVVKKCTSATSDLVNVFHVITVVGRHFCKPSSPTLLLKAGSVSNSEMSYWKKSSSSHTCNLSKKYLLLLLLFFFFIVDLTFIFLTLFMFKAKQSSHSDSIQRVKISGYFFFSLFLISGMILFHFCNNWFMGVNTVFQDFVFKLLHDQAKSKYYLLSAPSLELINV